MALYNKMRPVRFSDVKGQDKEIRIIKENIRTGNLPNAMLLIGTRGVGKTTIAKIVAKTVNCEHPLADGECCDQCPSCLSVKSGTSMDVLELDAASNNGVDHIRGIIEKVQYRPIGKMRVIILDEVHMLSISAFNALLKLLEEPPADTLFILCTTEAHKIPVTILSRCRKFQFSTISEDMIIEKLTEINSIYGLTAEKAALRLVATAAKGSMRDAESIYENFLDVENRQVTVDVVRDTLGFMEDEIVFSVLNGILSGDASMAFSAVQRTVERGGSLSYLVEEIFRVLMDIISLQSSGDISVLAGSEQYVEQVSSFAFGNNMARLVEIADGLRKVYEHKNGNLELMFQSTVLNLICKQSSISELNSRISALEEEIAMLRSQGVVCANHTDDRVEERAFSACQTMEEVVSSCEEPASLAVANDHCTEGFVPLSEEQQAELASLGFAVDMSNTDSREEVEATISSNVAATDDYFSGFASIFNKFGL